MLNALQPWHVILLVVALVVIFGGKRLPEAARGLGKSMRVFKSEVKAMQDEAHADDKPAEATSAAPAQITPAANAQPQPQVQYVYLQPGQPIPGQPADTQHIQPPTA
jgi:sec-independent protein translocase protein TatA